MRMPSISSPVTTVLPLMMARGLVLLKKIPANFNSTGQAGTTGLAGGATTGSGAGAGAGVGVGADAGGGTGAGMGAATTGGGTAFCATGGGATAMTISC